MHYVSGPFHQSCDFVKHAWFTTVANISKEDHQESGMDVFFL
jgi:hypothetical protein